MSDHLLDNVARIMASQVPRRQAVKLIASGFAAAVMAHFGIRSLLAQTSPSLTQGSNSVKCGNGYCPPGSSCINKQCCPSNLVCGSGTSQTCCPPLSTCIDNNCCASSQVCGKTCCPAGQSCINGACCLTTQVCVTFNGPVCCASPNTCVAGQCCPQTRYCSSTKICCPLNYVCNAKGECVPSSPSKPC